jgi:putative lipoic acid-binding regulatory protein
MADETNETLLTFPCDFTIKIFGTASPAFDAAVSDIIHKHIPTIAENAFQRRPSANGKYSAISVTVYVASKEQLDKIYIDLTANPHVLMAL